MGTFSTGPKERLKGWLEPLPRDLLFQELSAGCHDSGIDCEMGFILSPVFQELMIISHGYEKIFLQRTDQRKLQN